MPQLKAVTDQLWSSNLSKMWFPHCPQHLSHTYWLLVLVSFLLILFANTKSICVHFKEGVWGKQGCLTSASLTITVNLPNDQVSADACKGKVPGCNMKQNGERPLFLKVLKGHVTPPLEHSQSFLLSFITLVGSKRMGPFLAEVVQIN